MSTDRNAWPRPYYDPHHQPHILFIVTPPSSGSTALAKILNTSHRTTFLQKRAEGQWLIPGLCAPGRWDPQRVVNLESIRATWLQRFQMIQRRVPNVDTVIEKSPPNMLRIDALCDLFERSSLLVLNRDPYANCASILYRNYPAASLAAPERAHILRGLARDWVFRSQTLREVVERHQAPRISYEQLCASPAETLRRVPLSTEILASLDPGANVRVKDYPLGPLHNFNEHQRALLSAEEIYLLSQELHPQLELLDYFGYSLQGTSQSVFTIPS